MTRRTVTQSSFVLERTYDATPARVFAAWTEPAQKARWFHGPADWVWKHAIDFRVGGSETNVGGPRGGTVHRFDARFYDIIPNERIIYTYEMHLDDARISVSLATLELHRAGKGTRVVFSEQGAYLDGYDDAGRREAGTRELLGLLATCLAESPPGR